MYYIEQVSGPLAAARAVVKIGGYSDGRIDCAPFDFLWQRLRDYNLRQSRPCPQVD